MAYGRSVTVQRHRYSGDLKVSVLDQPTNLLTVVGARDAYNNIYRAARYNRLNEYKKTGEKTQLHLKMFFI